MFSNEQWLANPSSGFYNGIATTSLRFNQADNANLKFDPSGASNQKTWVCSAWVKKTANGTTSAGGADRYVFNTFTAGNNANCAVMGFRNDKPFYSTFSVEVLVATQVCRDTSAWYHLVWALDTTQATATNRLQIYINGSKITSFSVDARSNSYLNQNNDLAINNGNEVRVGNSGASSSPSAPFDGYLAEVNFIDGQSFFSDTSGTANSSFNINSFGETKNGVWIPIDTSGLTFGTNGFRLQFEQTGDGSSTASSTTIGADTANSNHFKDTNLDAYDSSMPDSPENNFCTLNTLDKVLTSSALSQGNLSVSAGGNAWNNIINSTFSITSGKWYWEVIALTGAGFGKVGVRQNNSLTSADSHSAGASEVYLYNGNKQQGATSTDSAYYGSAMYGDGNIFGIALDMDSGKIWVAKNNTYGNSGNPETGANAMFTNLTEPQSPSFSSYNMPVTFNFGADGSFAGDLTSGIGTATDGNGNGLFKYAPPSGFLSLCTNNLEDSTIGANSDTQADDHFEAVIYEGDGSVQNIAVNFQPDLTWIKNRDATDPHQLFDSSRGATFPFAVKEASKGDIANDDTLTDFIATGFTLGDDVNVNTNNESYVSWNWKAVATPSKTYKVVVVSDSGNKYRFRNSADSATFGTSAVTLNLQESGTYTFDYSDSTATSHPFRFSTTSDGTHGGGSEYTTGVVKDDTAKTIKITVPASAPTLYYYCSAHSGMGGQVNTNVTHGSTNFDGSILSVSQTNTDVGFSVVRYRGTGANGTFGHGVEVNGVPTSPAVMWFKHIQGEDSWAMWHHRGMTANNQYYPFNTSNPLVADGNMWNAGVPSTTVVNLGTNSIVNRGSPSNQGEFVCYCFAEVEGYSKFGVYYGNNDANGTFIFTNFKPAYVLTKRADGTGSNWYINDTARFLGNITTPLYIDLNNAESGNGIDILSNGFKIRNADASQNASNIKYIFMAFAEESFKYANAR